MAQARLADPYRDLRVVDSRAPRFNQLLIGSLSLVALVTGWWGILVVLAAQLVVGLTLGRRFCVQCLFYFEVIQRVLGEGPLEDARPPRFSNAVGAAFLSSASATYAVGWDRVGFALGAIVAALALLAAVTGFCAGCNAYKLVARLRGKPFVSCPIPGRG